MNEEIKTLAGILRHQKQVSFMLRQIAREIEKRADIHDLSKLELDELEGFCQLDAKRNYQKEEYGSKNYEDGIKVDAVRLHLSRNPHHPEFYRDGLEDMTFFDLLEMLCDWEVARRTRDKEQDIEVTWKIRQKRFNLTDDQILLLRNIWNRLLFNIEG